VGKPDDLYGALAAGRPDVELVDLDRIRSGS
jgi:hypothetical protein